MQAPLRDGVAFGTAGIATERIVEDADYPGVRLAIPVAFAGARGHLQVEIGFGDVVTPGPQELAFPTLLAYSVETVVAEKFEAMIKLSLVNSHVEAG